MEAGRLEAGGGGWRWETGKKEVGGGSAQLQFMALPSRLCLGRDDPWDLAQDGQRPEAREAGSWGWGAAFPMRLSFG